MPRPWRSAVSLRNVSGSRKGQTRQLHRAMWLAAMVHVVRSDALRQQGQHERQTQAKLSYQARLS